MISSVSATLAKMAKSLKNMTNAKQPKVEEEATNPPQWFGATKPRSKPTAKSSVLAKKKPAAKKAMTEKKPAKKEKKPAKKAAPKKKEKKPAARPKKKPAAKKAAPTKKEKKPAATLKKKPAAKKAAPRKKNWKEEGLGFKIAGISFRTSECKEAVRSHGEVYAGDRCTTKHRASLVPDPTNPYDSNAIKVMISGHHVGFVPKVRLVKEGGKIDKSTKH